MAIERILVACPARARLLERDATTGTLWALRTITEGEAAAASPVAGRSDPQAASQSPQRRRHLRFAAALARQLAQSLEDGRCERITLVSACPFLGALRTSLAPHVRAAVTSTINLDMVDASLAAIAGELARCGSAEAARAPAW